MLKLLLKRLNKNKKTSGEEQQKKLVENTGNCENIKMLIWWPMFKKHSTTKMHVLLLKK